MVCKQVQGRNYTVNVYLSNQRKLVRSMFRPINKTLNRRVRRERQENIESAEEWDVAGRILKKAFLCELGVLGG